MTGRAVVYCRQSLDRFGDLLAVDRQREDCLKLADARGFEVAHVRVDNDISARTGKERPGFDALLHDIESGDVNAVIATELTRLTRNLRDQLRIMEACKKHETILVFTRGGDLAPATANGAMLLTMLTAVATNESDVKGERQRASIAQAVKQGRRVSGRRPFGYDSGGMTVRDDEAAAIRQGYDDLLAGVPFVDIARTWNAAGFRTGQRARTGERKGELNLWTGDTVRGVLKNPRYAKLRAHTPEPERGRRKHKTEGLPPAQWPRIVSEETWLAAVEKMSARPGRGTGQLGTPRMLLTGTATCGVCGSGVWGSRTTQGMPAYRCRGSSGHFMRRSEPIDELIGDVVVARFERPDAAELLIDDTRPDAEELRAKRLALQSRLDGLADLFADGTLTAAQVRSAADRLRAELASVEAQQAHTGQADVLGPLVHSDDVRAVWDALDVARQRIVVRTLLRVVIDPTGRGSQRFRPETVRISPA